MAQRITTMKNLTPSQKRCSTILIRRFDRCTSDEAFAWLQVVLGSFITRDESDIAYNSIDKFKTN